MPLLPLNEKAEDLLEDMPPYEAEDPWVHDIMNALGHEFERLESFITFLQDHLRPTTATDQYRLLGIWESIMGLPVEPTNEDLAPISLSARQARVAAAAQRLRQGTGAGWVLALSLAVGNYAWTVVESDPDAYEITVEMPFPSDTFAAGSLEQLIREITPAHLRVWLTYGDTFRVGISEVGDSL